MNIKDAAQEFYQYSQYIRGYSKATIKRYKYAIEYYARFANINTLEEVTEENVRQLFYFGRVNRNWNAGTFISYHKSLVVFFRWCRQQRYLTHDPISNLEVPKQPKSLRPKLNKQNALRLLEVTYNYPYHHRFLRYRNHAIFSVFLFAGLRKQELLNLKLSDIDLENRTLFVKNGKGGKDRLIPITPKLEQTLRQYLVERSKLNKTNPEFFSSLYKNIGYCDTGLKRLVRQIKEASGVEFTLHKLRHTFATLMLEGGCDIYSLSKMMGHSDINTTTIYLAASAEHLRSQIGKHPLNYI